MNNKGLCFYLRVTVSWWHLKTTTAWTEVNLKCGGVVEHKVFSVFSMIYDVAWKEIPLHPVLQLVRVNWISLYLIQVLTGRTTTLHIDPDWPTTATSAPQTKENSFSIDFLGGTGARTRYWPVSRSNQYRPVTEGYLVFWMKYFRGA